MHSTYGGLAVHNSQLHSDLQTLPIHCRLLNIITDLLRSLEIKQMHTASLPFPEDRLWEREQQEKRSLHQQHADKLYAVNTQIPVLEHSWRTHHSLVHALTDCSSTSRGRRGHFKLINYFGQYYSENQIDLLMKGLIPHSLSKDPYRN